MVPAVFILGTGRDIGGLALLAGLMGLAAITGVLRVIAWRRHTYEFTGGRIVERSGIISRSERALEIERIQQVDVERTLLDRVVGTCELRLETAADSGDSELSLRVVSVEEARRLRSLLAHRIGAEPVAGAADAPSGAPGEGGAAGEGAAVEGAAGEGAAGERDHGTGDPGVFVSRDAPAGRADEEVLVTVALPRVALAAVTGPRLLAVPAAFAVLFGLIAENARPDDIVDTAESTLGRLSVTGIGLLVVGVLLVSVVIAAITGVIRDGGFTISRRGSDLRVRRGLTTTRSATVPLRRVQRVTVRRRWLQARLGFASVTVHSAGGSGGGDPNSASGLDRSLTVPLMPDAEVDALVHRLLGVDAVPALHHHPPAARRRAVFRGVLGMLVPSVLVTIGALVIDRPLLTLLVVPLVLLGILTGLRNYRWLASGAHASAVAGRSGMLSTRTEISPLRKTQGTTVTSTPFQRRRGLASLAVHVAGPAGGIALVDLALSDAQDLAERVHP